MTCTPHPATFRLLDTYVGWDESTGSDGEPGADGIVGFDDPAGLRLAYRGTAPQGPTRNRLLPWFPDPRLAPGCGPCAWYLLVPGERRLLRRDACGGFTPVWPTRLRPRPAARAGLVSPRADTGSPWWSPTGSWCGAEKEHNSPA